MKANDRLRQDHGRTDNTPAPTAPPDEDSGLTGGGGRILAGVISRVVWWLQEGRRCDL